jgi:VWFA-related protein
MNIMPNASIRTLALFLLFVLLAIAPVATPAAPGKEKKTSAQTETVAPGVIKSESSVVLVDVVVTDKKRNYLKDLTQKEFHVFEDGAEQPITSFSREVDIQPGTPERQRYMVIFFDDQGLGADGQMLARNAAAKFVDGTASARRMMAVINYDEGLHVIQNFTADRDRLMSAVRKTKFAPFQTSTDEMPRPRGGQRESDPAPRNLLLAIRDVARMLGTAPGRKTILFLSAGFDLISGRSADYQDTIVALNKANVGVYTISARGLVGLDMASGEYMPPWTRDSGPGVFGGAPSFPGGLPQLAAQTGGFAIVNANDLLGEMQKVSEEMNEYYLLGYVPPNPSHDGRYHKIHVKVDRAGAEVRARSGYSDTRSLDLLAGKTEGIALEAKVESFEAGGVPVTLSAPYFYIKPGVARVNLALSVPGSAIDFEKHGDKFRLQMNVLGIAYSDDDGSAAARFSDTVNLDYEKDERRQLVKASYDYQTSFRIASGEYTLKVVLSVGSEKFGKYVLPLMVDPFSGKQFTLSGPAFGSKFVPSPIGSADIDQSLIEGSAPMVASGMQVVPSSDNRFKKDTQPVVYVEAYDPVLESSNPQIGILFDIVNRTTREKVYSSNTISLSESVHQGNPLVPAIFNLPMDKLPPGDYRIEIVGRDSGGNTAAVRTGDFSIE